MIKVTIKTMSITEYAQLGYRTINHLGKEYRIMCPNETEAYVDDVTVTKDGRRWGIKNGKKIDYALPIYGPTKSERTCEGKAHTNG